MITISLTKMTMDLYIINPQTIRDIGKTGIIILSNNNILISENY